MIACDQQATFPRVPKREREHSTQMFAKSISVSLVQRDDDFAVAAGEKDVALLLELPTQLAIVVYLAISDQADRTVIAPQRLCAAGKVYDREPSMPQCDAAILVCSLAVRAAMPQRVQHTAHSVASGVAVGRKQGGEPAHRWLSDS